MERPLTLAAVIPTFRRWNHLVRTVRQLLGQTRVPDEIIIVDQTPKAEIDPREVSQLEQLRCLGVRIIYHRQNDPHVYRARNQAASLSTSDVLLYLDDDVDLDPNLVRNHLANFSDPRIDAVVGRVQTLSAPRAGLPSPPKRLSPTRRAFTFGKYRDDVRLTGISYLVAGNVCIRRKALAAIGGWDEHIRTYGDKDLGLRLYAAGKNIVYDPSATLVHLVAPQGGSRLADPQSPWTSWQRSASIMVVAFRHLRGRELWKFGFLRAAQHTFLLRRHAVRPTRWFPELFGYVRGAMIALHWVRQGVLSSVEWASPSVETGCADVERMAGSISFMDDGQSHDSPVRCNASV